MTASIDRAAGRVLSADLGTCIKVLEWMFDGIYVREEHLVPSDRSVVVVRCTFPLAAR